MPGHIYGPVPSRRLGSSLGVDLVPLKTCTLNCIYCQLGPTEETTLKRADYTPVDKVVEEVHARLEEVAPPDYVTLGGSGEPTLHASFGDIARGIHSFCDVPICLLTNGTLFFLPEVRAACEAVDLIVPSLDAADESTFQKVNRPHPDLHLDRILEGLIALREEFDGEIWVEIFLVPGINDSPEQIREFREVLQRIQPDRVHLNTAIRPPAEREVRPLSRDRLEDICARLGPRAEVIADPSASDRAADTEVQAEDVLDMLRRRPCTVEDVASGLGANRHVIVKHLTLLMSEAKVEEVWEDERKFYRAC